MAFHPYLFFGRNCREAFTRYQEVFGGELYFVTAQEMPPGEAMPDVPPDLIMHAALTVGGDVLMASDDPTTETPGPKEGIRVNYEATDASEAQRVFGALAEGGDVQLPIGPTSFSPMFGMCVDRFGIPWMISTAAPAEGS